MIHGLGDLKKKEERKEDRKSTDFFAGGQKSGLAVQSPDDVESMLNRARQSGSDTGARPDPNEVTITVTLYENGFTVDDGPFRDYEAPENKRFIAEMNQNRVPGELLAKTKGKPVAVNLSDKRRERYVPPPPPKYVAFSGEGQRMSGASSVPAGTVDLNLAGPSADSSQPTTSVQVRFHNGQRKTLTVNLTTRVQAIYEYVMMAAPVDGEYQLLSGFPPKPLTDPRQTVQEAGIANGAVIQKLL
jgi:UBX domain-containing protein 1